MEPVKKIIISIIIYGIFLTILVLFLKSVISWDVALFYLINSLSNPYLMLAFNIITYLGSSLFWILLIILFWLDKKRKMSLHLLYALVLNIISIFILKSIFARPRPFPTYEQDIIDTGYSFPSGHSQMVFSGAFVLSRFYSKYRIIFYVLAALTAFSRIYIGVHYPLDALVGSLNGLMVGMISLALPTQRIEKFFRKLK